MNTNIQFIVSILGLNSIFLPIWFISQSNCQGDEIKKVFTKNKIVLFILAEYFVCLAAVTIVPLPFSKKGTPYLNLDLFHQTYNNFYSAYYHTSNRTIWNETENLLGNIFLFFPFGFLLPIVNIKNRSFFKVFFLAALTSFLIETIQYFISINWGYNRIADIDDLVLNVFGAVFGLFLYKVYSFFDKSFSITD